MEKTIYEKCGDGLYTAFCEGGKEYSLRRIKPNEWQAVDGDGNMGSGKTRGNAIADCQAMCWLVSITSK